MRRNRILDWIFPLFIMGFILLLANSCKKKDDNNNTTAPTIPVLTTTAASNITASSASSGGDISSDGGDAVTARGVCWSTSQNPTTSNSKTSNGTGTGSFTSSITGLSASTTYYLRAFATNSIGTSYGNQVTVVTSSTTPTVPVITTNAVSIGSTSATSGGTITNNGGSSVTARGVCWSTNQNPTIADSKTSNGTGVGSFTSNITGLSASTTYYVRAYATNNTGTGYGNQLTFMTYSGSVTIDGRIYGTINIGTQVWLAENLKATHYRNGTAIPFATGTAWYNYYATYDTAKYGFLYNWNAVTDVDSIAPIGWHVPTNADFTTLITYLGGSAVAGGKLKETGTADWINPNTGATNSSGFTALPGGFYGPTEITQQGNFWSSTAFNSSDAYGLYLIYNSATSAQNNYLKSLGFSVRLVKN
jgi:uncharacterized protein (TIGR02145 family)